MTKFTTPEEEIAFLHEALAKALAQQRVDAMAITDALNDIKAAEERCTKMRKRLASALERLDQIRVTASG